MTTKPNLKKVPKTVKNTKVLKSLAQHYKPEFPNKLAETREAAQAFMLQLID